MWTYLDAYKSGDVGSRRAVIMLNGVGQRACHWPSALLSRLEKIALVVRLDFRGLSTPEYVPTVKDILKDIAHVRTALSRESPWHDELELYLLGYSFGGLATQLVISDPTLRPLFKGFVLVATTCEFIPASFAKTFAGKGEPPLENVSLVKSVFAMREVPAGRVESFIDGRPGAWTVTTKPDFGPLKVDWTESFFEYGIRKLHWLVPSGYDVSFTAGKAFREYVFCEKAPKHFSPRYVDFASTLMLDAENKPGKGELFERIRKIPDDAGTVLKQRVLVATGSQDGLFPLDHFCSLVEQMKRVFDNTTAVVFKEKSEVLVEVRELERRARPGHELNVVEVGPEPGGHALLFQDSIAVAFGDLLSAWLIKKT